MSSSNPLLDLRVFGQSVWYDNIGRDLLVSGAIKRLIEKDGVAGLTSNPTIFQRSIAGSQEYDHAIRDFVEMGFGTREILDRLTAQDITMAADLLRTVYENTGTKDGWVSIEVAPASAHDALATVAEARRLRSLVNRPNVFVKVPATAEGVRAIKELVSEGRNINVTLIFALERYGEVMEAYISGLETLVQRRAAGEDLPPLDQVHSVASFFVSRVDTSVDPLLEAVIESSDDPDRREQLGSLLGTAAIANAKLAYQAFLSTFSGSRWEALAAQGARLQRPLWASTSTKNPDYRDVRYIEELIGPDTVNTIPPATIDAFRDHGVVAQTVDRGADAARAQLERLEREGISMAEVTKQLEVEGVQIFSDSFDSLYAALDEKRALLAQVWDE